jgi:hypothetical protein
MNSEELIKKIKTILLRNYATSAELKQTEDDEMFLTDRFPQLKKVLIELLTPQFNEFVKDIEWVAPKPTTFRVILNNNANFYLIYTKKSWIVKVEGKKYYILNLPEQERAVESISKLLMYNFGTVEKEPESAPASEEKPAEEQK